MEIERIIVAISIIVIPLEIGFWLEGDCSLSAMLIKRFVIIEETYKLNNYLENTVETRFYPKRKNLLFFIPVDTVGLDLMTTLDYKQNYCLTLQEAQEAIKKYIEFNKTKGVKVHKYKEPKKEKESMTLYKKGIATIEDISNLPELILTRKDKK